MHTLKHQFRKSSVPITISLARIDVFSDDILGYGRGGWVHSSHRRLDAENVGINMFESFFEYGWSEMGYKWNMEDDYEFTLQADYEREWFDAVHNKEANASKEKDATLSGSDQEGSEGSEFVFIRQEECMVDKVEVDMGQSVLHPTVEIVENAATNTFDVEELEVVDTNIFRSYSQP
ncbi:hypothetical protein L2E82_24498 [Cichorium intybus]|uniref:Uncharacterized protein n=1 Tax=Cichorium intybus TaxID=13427 RepID=A0ACB9E171_CICIN|nr:hypothetical protein L2E82_24498 [Cichorium intybus]